MNRNILEYQYAFIEAPDREELTYSNFGRPLSMLTKEEIEVIDSIMDDYLDEEFYYNINLYDEENEEHRRLFELQDRIPFGKNDII